MTLRILAAATALLLAAGCTLTYPFEGGVAVAVVPHGAAETHGSTEMAGDEQGQRVAHAARQFVGRTNMSVGDKRFNYDCSGTILAIYYAAGIDLLPDFAAQGGNGVRRLYGIARDHRLLYAPKLPRPGDIIFWDNTYDRNGDGRWNDELTHAGIVTSVTENGQVEYVHHNYRRGIVVERMNLYEPDVHTGTDGLVNSPMRMRSHRYINPSEWLASHLYREAGRLHQL